MPGEQDQGRHGRQRHCHRESEEPVAQAVGELAAQKRARDVAQREHRQGNGKFDQGHAIGDLHESGEIDHREPVADALGDAGTEKAQNLR